MTKAELNFTTPLYTTKAYDDFLDTLSLETLDICIAKRELNRMKDNNINVSVSENNIIMILESKMITLLSAYLGKDEYFDVRAVEIEGTEYLIDKENFVYYDTEGFTSFRPYKNTIIDHYFFLTEERCRG